MAPTRTRTTRTHTLILAHLQTKRGAKICHGLERTTAETWLKRGWGAIVKVRTWQPGDIHFDQPLRELASQRTRSFVELRGGGCRRTWENYEHGKDNYGRRRRRDDCQSVQCGFSFTAAWAYKASSGLSLTGPNLNDAAIS